MKKMSGSWRNSASLIILSKKPKLTDEDFDYNVLMIERAKTMSFMARNYVFPGGVQEDIDSSPFWLKYLEQHCSNGSSKINIGSRREKERQVPFRITAVRETFEEAGLLLCNKKSQLRNENEFSQYFNELDTEFWQKSVHNNANQFIELCKYFQLFPDIWNLYSWSCWLTPSTFTKRFLTQFFLAVLKEEPNIKIEDTESVNYLWKTPKFFLEEFRRNRLSLPVPQLYELARLASQKNIDFIKDFARDRQLLQNTVYLPVNYKCINGIVSVLPGDEKYPEEPFDQEGFIDVNSTVEDFRSQNGKAHRIFYVGENRAEIELNFKPLDGHLAPFNSKLENKL